MTAAALPRRRGAWPVQLALPGSVAVLILLLFRRDGAAMAAIWWTSSTFNHVLLVPPLIAWLVSLRARDLARVTPAAWWPALLIVAAGAFGWLLGAAAEADVVRQLGLVVMVQGAVVALLGPAVTRALLFPIGFALFLVPMGEALVPPLQTLTARMCILLLGWAGVPASIDGVFITTPAGWFEVAEACSGVKFLVAMIAYGALVANLCFASPWRRAGFMAAAVAVPVIANGLRAFGTIWIAERTTIDFAAGFDHVVYGWIFFALVIAATMAAGWPFFDRRPGMAWFDAEALGRMRFRAAPGGAVAAAVLALAVLPLAWSGAGRAVAPVPPVALPAVAGWTRVAAADGVPWRPHFAGADRLAIGHYREAGGATVDLAIAVYARQDEGRELVGFGQGAVAKGSGWAWAAAGAPVAGGRAERIVGPGGATREVVSFYRVGERLTGSAAGVKLETMKVRLIGGRQRAVAVLVSAEGRRGRAAIDRFLNALGPVAGVADRAAGGE